MFRITCFHGKAQDQWNARVEVLTWSRAIPHQETQAEFIHASSRTFLALTQDLGKVIPCTLTVEAKKQLSAMELSMRVT
nr:hypothetical protein Iba_chr03eCG4510 [Ipomoea batatas]